MTRSPLILLATSFLVCACGNALEEFDNVLVAPKAEGPCADLLVPGDWYRFTKLEVAELSGGGATLLDTVLNPLWAKDIVNGELNVLFTVLSVSADAVDIRMVSGARVGEGDSQSICQMEHTAIEITVPITASGIGPSPQVNMDVFAGSIEAPKNCATDQRPMHALPVDKATIQASCDAASGLISGEIVGGLGEKYLATTCTCVSIGSEELSHVVCGTLNDPPADPAPDTCDACQSTKPDGTSGPWLLLSEAINTFNGGPLSYDCEDADGDPAACVTAIFNALQIEGAPSPCE